MCHKTPNLLDKYEGLRTKSSPCAYINVTDSVATQEVWKLIVAMLWINITTDGADGAAYT